MSYNTVYIILQLAAPSFTPVWSALEGSTSAFTLVALVPHPGITCLAETDWKTEIHIFNILPSLAQTEHRAAALLYFLSKK